MTLGIFCVRRWTRYLQSVDLELMALGSFTTCVSCLFLANSWYVPEIYGIPAATFWTGSSEVLDSEFQTLMELVTLVSGVCLYLPIRTCISWILPVAAVLSYVAVLCSVGTPFPEWAPVRVVQLAFLCFFAWRGAQQHENSAREKWSAQAVVKKQELELEESAAMTQAMKQVGGSLSDMVVRLSGDLRIMGSDSAVTSYFGEDLDGESFVALIAQHDQDRFKQLVASASAEQMAQSMPTTLKLHMGETLVQLLVACASFTKPAYLVGVQVGDAAATMETDQEIWLATLPSSASEVREWPREDVFVEIDALSKDLRVLHASDGWRNFCCGGEQRTAESLKGQLDSDVFVDLRRFVRKLAERASSGQWEAASARHVYRELEGGAPGADASGPPGVVYRAILYVTVPDPASAYDPGTSCYRVVLSLTQHRPPANIMQSRGSSDGTRSARPLPSILEGTLEPSP